MSDEPDDDIYHVSDTSSGGDIEDEEDITDIIENINLDAIRQQVLSQMPEVSIPNQFQTGPQYEIYNRYIPQWMNPSAVFRPRYPLRHPAVRPDDMWQVKDEWVLPSEYAKRYGVDKRAPPENPARSMLSPNNQDPLLGWTEDFQAKVFLGYTADELKAQGAFDPDMQIDDQLDGLNSPIHPLIRRGNWIQNPKDGSSEQQPIWWYHINGRDHKWDAAQNDTLWEAMQPALQLISKVLYSNHPFLHAMHDICKLSPMDKSRIPVPPPPDPRQPGEPGPKVPQELWGILATVNYELDDRDMYPEAVALRDSGFDSVKVVEQIVKTYIKFRFEDTDSEEAYAFTAFRTHPRKLANRFEIIISISPDIVWPLLLPTYSKSERFVCSTTIASVILHEIAHCVRDAVAVMTEHENWHTDPALGRARPDDDEPVQIDVSTLSNLHHYLLLSLGTKIGTRNRGVRFPQFYFQNEQRSEEGWAFENQLWGGIPCTLPDLEQKTGFPHVVSWLQQWPYPRNVPRPYYMSSAAICGEVDDAGWPNWLLDPPPSLLHRSTALPVTSMTRLFREEFWSTVVAKYSHQALRFQVHEWQGQPLKSSFTFAYHPPDAFARGFLSGMAWPWLAQSINILTEIREDTLSEYIFHRTARAAGPDVIRRRLHYERKRWRTADSAMDERAGEITRFRGVSVARLAEYRDRGRDDHEERLGLYFEQARLITTAAHDLVRIAGWEITTLQFLVSEIARLDDGDRDRVSGQLLHARARLERKFKPVLEEATNTVKELLQELNGVLRSYFTGAPASTAASSSTVVPAPAPPRVPDSERLMVLNGVLAAYEVVNSTHNMAVKLAETVDTIQEYKTRPEAWAAVHETFNLLAEVSSDRQHRNRVERLAQHRLRELPRDSPILTIVSACYRILSRTTRY